MFLDETTSKVARLKACHVDVLQLINRAFLPPASFKHCKPLPARCTTGPQCDLQLSGPTSAPSSTASISTELGEVGKLLRRESARSHDSDDSATELLIVLIILILQSSRHKQKSAQTSMPTFTSENSSTLHALNPLNPIRPILEGPSEFCPCWPVRLSMKFFGLGSTGSIRPLLEGFLYKAHLRSAEVVIVCSEKSELNGHKSLSQTFSMGSQPI